MQTEVRNTIFDHTEKWLVLHAENYCNRKDYLKNETSSYTEVYFKKFFSNSLGII